jgi:hypothetical protein
MKVALVTEIKTKLLIQLKSAVYIDIDFRFHKSKLANRPLDTEHVKYTDTTEQNTGRSNKVHHCHL